VSGAAAWLSLDTHTPVKGRKAGSDALSHTKTHTRGFQRKDTRHGERLGEGMESAAPGDLPGSDVNQDEMEFQQQLTHLDMNRNTQLTENREQRIICDHLQINFIQSGLFKVHEQNIE